MNQLDLIDRLIEFGAERDIVTRIVSDRRNLRDPYAAIGDHSIIRAGFRAARHISHCRFHGEIPEAEKAALRSK